MKSRDQLTGSSNNWNNAFDKRWPRGISVQFCLNNMNSHCEKSARKLAALRRDKGVWFPPFPGILMSVLIRTDIQTGLLPRIVALCHCLTACNWNCYSDWHNKGLNWFQRLCQPCLYPLDRKLACVMRSQNAQSSYYRASKCTISESG